MDGISDVGSSSFQPSYDFSSAAPDTGNSVAVEAASASPAAPAADTGSIAPDSTSMIGPGQTSQISLNDRPEQPQYSVPPAPKEEEARRKAEPSGGTPVAHSHIDPYSDGVRQTQLKMQAAGIDPGPIDGLKGPLTRAAMRQYETKFGKSAADGLGVDPSWAELPRNSETRARKEAADRADRGERPGTPGTPPAGNDKAAVGSDGIATFQGKKMTPGTARDLARMAEAARRDGVPLTVNSAYRDPAYQAKLFRQAVQKYGSEAAARKWVAPPGRSEHQTGKAVDLSMGNGRVHEWLRRNATRFGFTQSYSWEPWHWFHRAS